MLPQSLHWPEQEDLYSQQHWLESKNHVTGSLVLHVYSIYWYIFHRSMRFFIYSYSLPMHTEVAGFGVHIPLGDIPSDVHTAVIFPVGTNPVLHLKSISAPPSVLGTATMEPFPEEVGIPQLTI